MTILHLPFNWGTWIDGSSQHASHGSDTFMKVGAAYSTYGVRSLMKFDYNGIPGAMQSASLNFYVTNSGGAPMLQVWRITRASTANATWQVSPITAWHAPGAENMNNDRYQIPLTAQYQITTTGWHSIPITSLEQLQLFLDGLKILLLRNDDTREPAIIAKSPAPYLAIDYKSSLAGGVQII